MQTPIIPTRIVPSARPSDASPRQIASEFRERLGRGARLAPAGDARHDPSCLLRRGYGPRFKIELFDATYYLSNARQNEDIRFYVAYVGLGAKPRVFYPRIFYKDISLIWRSGSHYASSDEQNWIGKGDLKTFIEDGKPVEYSAEETTDLPLELQTALEALLGLGGPIRTDRTALGLVLRRAPDDRIEPYQDFSGPRARARANPRNLINRGRSIATFARAGDPSSLRIAAGFEPDFADGIVELSRSRSRLYGGPLRRYRIVSTNRKIQYIFFAGRRQVWISYPQATTTEIMSYGTRTIDVIADEDLSIPGLEYHYMDDSEDPPVLHSQIPAGYAGPISKLDASRAEAAPWIDRLPVVQEFRRKVLGQKKHRLARPARG